jgi:hypothetical protein
MAETIYFTGPNISLQKAVDADDPAAISQALQNGADVNARERLIGGTILEYAVAQFKNRAVATLLEKGADPNLRDKEGNNAVILAVAAYPSDKMPLELVLKHGGDPNTFAPDGSYIIDTFLALRDFTGLKYLVHHGADLNVRQASEQPPNGKWISGAPFGGWKMQGGPPEILYAATAANWDVVLEMLKLGAKYDYPDDPDNFTDLYKGRWASGFPPGSWPYYYQLKCYEFMTSHGYKLPPFGPGAGGDDHAPANLPPPTGPDPFPHT